MKTTLLIMAAGIGSLFGEGVKQLEPVGMNGEIIMDYSIHDAIEAGFQKIIFILRKEIEEDFKEVIGDRIEKICEKLGVEVQYEIQSLTAIPDGFCVPEGRKKPWGTGQAVLAAKNLLKEPFVVINADDYYGKSALKQMHEFLLSYRPENSMEFCMAGFILKNTLSEHGGVTRGICKVDERGYLTDIVETKGIVKTDAGAIADDMEIDVDSYVSMNMWGMTPEFIPVLEDGFADFLKNLSEEDVLKKEYILPVFIGQLLQEQKISVKVIECKDQWFGVTYKEDKESVIRNFRKLIENGVYQEDLYGDLKEKME